MLHFVARGVLVLVFFLDRLLHAHTSGLVLERSGVGRDWCVLFCRVRILPLLSRDSCYMPMMAGSMVVFWGVGTIHLFTSAIDAIRTIYIHVHRHVCGYFA